MCKTLMPDVVAPEAHQNDRSYVHELSRSEFSMVGSYTEDLTHHKTVKIRGWVLARGWALAWDDTSRKHSDNYPPNKYLDSNNSTVKTCFRISSAFINPVYKVVPKTLLNLKHILCTHIPNTTTQLHGKMAQM